MINFKKIYEEFQGDIPCGECDLCEQEADFVVLLPGELEYLQSLEFPATLTIQDNVACLTGECSGCSPKLRHKFRAQRPIDCRTYPFAVIKQGESFVLCVSYLCPLHHTIPDRFILDVKYVWEHLLTKPEVIEHLTQIPVDTDFNPTLKFSSVCLLSPKAHPELDE